MDKVTLAKEQLEELKSFINSRGFTDSILMLEILDHFACKVEEELERHPHLSLRQAMEKAHASFGALGFLPLVTAYELGIRSKYKAVYFCKLKKNLKSLPKLLVTVASGFIVYKSYTLSRFFQNDWFALGEAVMLVAFFVMEGFLAFSEPKRHAGNYYVRQIRTVHGWLVNPMYVMIIFHFTYYTSPMAAILYASIFALYVFRFIALYPTLREAQNEYKELYTQIENNS